MIGPPQNPSCSRFRRFRAVLRSLSVRPMALGERGHGIDDASEGGTGPWIGGSCAQITVRQARLFEPERPPRRGKDAVAVDFAVGGKRIALRREDHRRRKVAEIPVAQRLKRRIY